MPPDGWANAGYIDVVLDGEYGFSTVRVGAILGNGRGTQGQNYVLLL